MNIGEKIRERRKELGWSLRELANRMGYANHSAVQRIEKGVVDVPQSKIEKFSEVLRVPVSYLMSWEEIQKNNDIISDVVVRMRTDEGFLRAVESLYNMDSERLDALSALLK